MAVVERPVQSAAAGPRVRPRPRRWALLALATVLAAAAFGVLAFVVGSVSVYRLPVVANQALRVDTELSGLLNRWRAGSRPTPDTAAMAANRFAVVNNDSALDGTVLLALNGDLGVRGFPSRVVEVDRAGQVVWEYHLPDDRHFITDVRKLPNGNVLFVAATLDDLVNVPLEAKRWKPAEEKMLVYEVDQGRNVVRRQSLPATHHAEMLPDGNLLLVDSVGDTVNEVAPDGRFVWTWDGAEHIQRYTPQNYTGLPQGAVGGSSIRNMYAHFREGMLPGNDPLAGAGGDWLHLNSAQRLPNGNTVLSIRNLDLVAEVNPRGEVVWSYGALVLKHQHCAWVLENGNLLVSDNGNARIIEVDRGTQEIVWEYSEGLMFPVMGCAYRLPDGNTLITDSGNRRAIEVTPDKRVVWELKLETPGAAGLYRAWWSPE